MEDAIFDYHEATKHHPHRFARSLGYLDWATQPDPFRVYEGAQRIPLERFPRVEPRPYPALYGNPKLPSREIDHASLSEFFRYSVGLSAWKQHGGTRWALRVDPSSGNLHPTEVYCVLGATPGVVEQPGILHYVSDTHTLEERGRLTGKAWRLLGSGPPSESFLVGVCSIHWRESWKYGERAYRYCQHDAGHVLATLSLSAALLGWGMRLLDGLADRTVAALLGLGREDSGGENEREVPDFLALVSRGTADAPSLPDAGLVEAALGDTEWHGQAGTLSRNHVQWPVIDQAHRAAENPGGIRISWVPAAREIRGDHQDTTPAEAHGIILQRRSALAYDPTGTLPLDSFVRMMRRTLPGPHPPWDALYWPPCIDLALFVHRVTGLDPGMYMFIRNPDGPRRLRESTSPDFSWIRPAGLPGEFPLYLLRTGDFRGAAEAVSCNQEIAGNGHFSLGMIADFAGTIRKWGSWFYRNLFWESGTVGQVMYLEAESSGARATGIGCYFDDAVHEMLDLKGAEFQSLYHFTVGSPVEDGRLTTLPPYGRQESGSGKP